MKKWGNHLIDGPPCIRTDGASKERSGKVLVFMISLSLLVNETNEDGQQSDENYEHGGRFALLMDSSIYLVSFSSLLFLV